MPDPGSGALDRRHFLAYFSSFGLTSTLFPGVLWSLAQEERKVTKEMVATAERIAGLQFTEEERAQMVEGLNENLGSYEALRKVPLANGVPPALRFDPVPPGRRRPAPGRSVLQPGPVPQLDVPADLEELAFWPVTHLAALLRQRQVSSVELTEMYLSRLRWFDEQLHCVVTLTEELALEQAERADDEIAAGNYRGPLHGIPWGAKDLFSTKGIRTTWGAKPFEQQVLEEDASVVRRLAEAGAVLVAKLSLGALAMGDVWFKGLEQRTRNPWNPEEGSSGSSAGSAAATAAGLVGFALGTETLGSIVSPSSRCGVTGLRPTFGRVSRAGAMALCWSMDKIGPLCRSVEDCALVLGAICGPDPLDPTAADVPFAWNGSRKPEGIRVGFLKDLMEGDGAAPADTAVLEVLRAQGMKLEPVRLPDLPAAALLVILNAEAAAAFDDLTRSGGVRELVRQDAGAWPNLFRTARLVPAVEYLRADRVRTLLMQEMAAIFDQVDVFVAPAFRGATLTITNLTGHPCAVLPSGFSAEGTPTSITFLGRLYGESELLTVAKAYQDATDFHRRHPDLER